MLLICPFSSTKEIVHYLNEHDFSHEIHHDGRCAQLKKLLDRKKIIAVINTTYAVVKRKPEKKNQACTGFEPYDLCDTGAVIVIMQRSTN